MIKKCQDHLGNTDDQLAYLERSSICATGAISVEKSMNAARRCFMEAAGFCDED